MKGTIKRTLATATGTLLLTVHSFATILISSDFTGSVLSGGDVLDITWTGVESTAASDLTAIYPSGESGFAQPGGLFGSDGAAYINTNLNIAPTSDLRGYSFTLTPAVEYDLIDLQVSVAHTNNAGGFQAFDSDLHVSIAEGVTPVFSITDPGVTYNGTWQNRSFDLSSITLAASTTYTVTVAMNNLVGAGAYFTSDGLEITGTAIPEPASLALCFGLGGLFLALRRRRA